MVSLSLHQDEAAGVGVSWERRDGSLEPAGPWLCSACCLWGGINGFGIGGEGKRCPWPSKSCILALWSGFCKCYSVYRSWFEGALARSSCPQQLGHLPLGCSDGSFSQCWTQDLTAGAGRLGKGIHGSTSRLPLCWLGDFVLAFVFFFLK